MKTKLLTLVLAITTLDAFALRASRFYRPSKMNRNPSSIKVIHPSFKPIDNEMTSVKLFGGKNSVKIKDISKVTGKFVTVSLIIDGIKKHARLNLTAEGNNLSIKNLKIRGLTASQLKIVKSKLTKELTASSILSNDDALDTLTAEMLRANIVKSITAMPISISPVNDAPSINDSPLIRMPTSKFWHEQSRPDRSNIKK